MHTKPLLSDWTATATEDGCVIIEIHDDLNIEGAEYKILGPARNPLVVSSIGSRRIYVCTPTDVPTFVELKTIDGVSVRYVEGSGSEAYKNN